MSCSNSFYNSENKAKGTTQKGVGEKTPLDINDEEYEKDTKCSVTKGKMSMNTMYNLFFHQYN